MLKSFVKNSPTFRAALGGLMALTVFSSCTKKEAEDGLTVYTIAHRDDMKTLDPANAYDSISLDVVPNIYASLYQYHYETRDTFRYEPLLAADMPMYSADRLTVRIPLRKGVRFQDDPCFPGGKGRELKAQDVVFGMKRLAIPSLESHGWWILEKKFVGIDDYREKLLKDPPAKEKGAIPASFDAEVEGIKVIDDYTIELKLIRPYPQLLAILSMAFTAPVPREAILAYADEKGNLQDHPVGTGQFMLEKWERGQQVILKKNPNGMSEFYPSAPQGKPNSEDVGKPLPLVDKVHVYVIKEQQPMWLRFMKGSLDVASIPKDNFAAAVVGKDELTPDLKKKGIKLHTNPGEIFYYLNFNVQDKILSNKLVRQALSSALDRDRWIQLFTNNRGTKMTTALPPGLPGRVENPKLKYDYDPERGKDLLKKAGYPDGKGLPVITMDMRGADSMNRQLGEFFTGQFAAIGVKVNVVYNTFPAYLEKMKKGQLQMSLGGWVLDYPDAENVFQLLYGGNRPPGPNDSQFDHPEMNKLYEQIAKMEPSPERSKLLAKMDEILQEECPWALGYVLNDYSLIQQWVKNYRNSNFIQNGYKYIRIDREKKSMLSGKL